MSEGSLERRVKRSVNFEPCLPNTAQRSFPLPPLRPVGVNRAISRLSDPEAVVLDRVNPPPMSTTGRSVGPYSGKSNAARSGLHFSDRYKRTAPFPEPSRS